MRDLDPFDASILHVLARVPETMGDLRQELLDRLEREGTDEGKEIARVILAPDIEQADTSDDVKATATSLKQLAGVS
jgi:hypothetical protein